MFYKKYPSIPTFLDLNATNTRKNKLLKMSLSATARLMHEYGTEGIQEILDDVNQYITESLEKLQNLPIDKELAKKEPNNLEEIKKLRPDAKRELWEVFDEKVYRDKLKGAMYSRFAGCIIGAAVEFWEIEDMEQWAKETGNEFPPTNYWKKTPVPYRLKYNYSQCRELTRDYMDGVPVDDDIAYTLLGLLIAEDYGIDFTTEDVGKAWLKYLSTAATAEFITLENLKNNIPWDKVGEINNPFCQWIGADIRSDPFAYMAPGLPEKAACMAYNDAYISHRRNGIYGEMYFSAVQSAAFAVNDPIKALELGLNEIPKKCALYNEIIWALEEGTKIKNFRQAREKMDIRYKGMDRVHTINNAALTIWGIMIGKTDIEKVISETVAMGMDNDCTAATAGSIVGAVTGFDAVPKKWYDRWNNIVKSYLIGHPIFKLDDLVDRFTLQAAKQFNKDITK